MNMTHCMARRNRGAPWYTLELLPSETAATVAWKTRSWRGRGGGERAVDGWAGRWSGGNWRELGTHLALVDAVRPEGEPEDVDEPEAHLGHGVHLQQPGAPNLERHEREDRHAEGEVRDATECPRQRREDAQHHLRVQQPLRVSLGGCEVVQRHERADAAHERLNGTHLARRSMHHRARAEHSVVYAEATTTSQRSAIKIFDSTSRTPSSTWHDVEQIKSPTVRRRVK